MSATPAHIWPGAFASMAMAGRPKSSVLAAEQVVVDPRNVRDARVMRQGLRLFMIPKDL